MQTGSSGCWYGESRQPWSSSSAGFTIPIYDYRDAAADPLGRRTRLNYSSGVNAAFMEDYGYNLRNELTSADHWENGVVDPAYDYVYDPIGNRTTYSVDPSIGDPEVTTYSTNNLNQYYRTDVADPKTAQGYRYDEDGNLLEMYVAADMNCDGVVDMNQDLSCFVAVINQCPPGPDPYFCAPCPCLNGDLDGDGAVTFADINRFVPLVNAVGARQAYAWDAENQLLSVGPPDPPASVRNAGPVRGMHGCKNIWQIPEDLHKYLHGGGPKGGRWNQAWWDELRVAGGPESVTAEQVVGIREKLIRQFNLEQYRP